MSEPAVVGYEMWVVCPNCGKKIETDEISETTIVVCEDTHHSDGCGAKIQAIVQEV